MKEVTGVGAKHGWWVAMLLWAAATQAQPRGAAGTTEGPSPPLDLLQGRGAVVGAPLYIPPPAGRTYVADHWLVFTRSAEGAEHAWTLRGREGAAFRRAVEDWPATVRVLGAVYREPSAFVLVETLAALDQQAGRRAVIEVVGDRVRRLDADGGPVTCDARLGGVTTMEDLRRWLATAPPADPRRMLSASTDGPGLTTAALARLVSVEGLDVVRVRMGTYAEAVEHLDAAAVAASSRAPAILAALQRARGAPPARGPHAPPPDSRDVAILGVVPERGEARLRTVVLAHEPVAPAALAAPRALPAGDVPDAAQDLVRAAIDEGTPRFLGAAGAGTDAEVGLVEVRGDDDRARPGVYLRAGAFFRYWELRGPDTMEPFDLSGRFLDVDGDRQADVLVWFEPRDRARPSAVAVYRVPAPSLSVPLSSALPADEPDLDMPSTLAISGARSLDDALPRALATSRRPVDSRAACALVRRVRTLDDLRRVSAPGARFLQHESMGVPTFVATPVDAAHAALALRRVGRRCSLTCAPGRMYCTSGDQLSRLYVWFSWEGDRLLLGGTSWYAGD